MKEVPNLRVCIDARVLQEGSSGGVQQTIIGLASGLSTLSDGNEEYFFLTYAGHEDWIRPYLHGPCKLLAGQPAGLSTRLKGTLKKTAARHRTWNYVALLAQAAGLATIPFSRVPASDGTIESAGMHIMHFTTQVGFRTNVPTIYTPHDLQHLHLPELFTPYKRRIKEKTYRSLCKQAQIVVAMTEWGKRDLIEQYGLTPEKIAVIPWASLLTAYPEPSADDLMGVKRKFELPDAFLFYPSQTWAHKNHVGLLTALALLRDRHGMRIPLVCSGWQNEFFPTIRRTTDALTLANQVRFVGFVGALELRSLYQLCRAMVFPSKFEGWGLPVTEAFQAGAPVVCSNATSLPDLAGDAALLFDPNRPEEIADAIRSIWIDDGLRRTLMARGRERVAQFSWERTARLFRARYRQMAGRALSDKDRTLLEAPPNV